MANLSAWQKRPVRCGRRHTPRAHHPPNVRRRPGTPCRSRSASARSNATHVRRDWARPLAWRERGELLSTILVSITANPCLIPIIFEVSYNTPYACLYLPPSSPSLIRTPILVPYPRLPSTTHLLLLPHFILTLASHRAHQRITDSRMVRCGAPLSRTAPRCPRAP